MWRMPTDSAESRLVVRLEDETVLDTVFTGGGALSTGVLEPGTYTYFVESSTADSLGAGRFDVAEATEEMLPVAEQPPQRGQRVAAVREDVRRGRPLRTLPWPYLFVITLLSVEWIGRRRGGLR